MEYATRFDSAESMDTAREKFAEEHGDAMRDQGARIDDGENLSKRYVNSTDTGEPVGNGIDQNGNKVEDIQTVTGVYKYNETSSQWDEVTIYPDAYQDEQRRKGR